MFLIFEYILKSVFNNFNRFINIKDFFDKIRNIPCRKKTFAPFTFARASSFLIEFFIWEKLTNFMF